MNASTELHHLADLVGGELRHLNLVRIDAGFFQDDAEQRDIDEGAADHADAMAGKILDRLDLGFAFLALRPACRPRRRPEHDDVLAHDGDRQGAVGHRFIGARDRKIGSACGERRNAVHRSCRGDDGEAHSAALAGESLCQRLDELLIVASGGADGHAQGGRAQDDEGCPDGGGKQQQSGGEHQKKRASFAATERQIAGARQAV